VCPGARIERIQRWLDVFELAQSSPIRSRAIPTHEAEDRADASLLPAPRSWFLTSRLSGWTRAPLQLKDLFREHANRAKHCCFPHTSWKLPKSCVTASDHPQGRLTACGSMQELKALGQTSSRSKASSWSLPKNEQIIRAGACSVKANSAWPFYTTGFPRKEDRWLVPLIGFSLLGVVPMLWGLCTSSGNVSRAQAGEQEHAILGLGVLADNP